MIAGGIDLSVRGRGRWGFILLSVAWCVLLLSLLLAVRVRRSELEMTASRLAQRRLRQRLAVRSVEAMVLAAMAEKTKAREQAKTQGVKDSGDGGKANEPGSANSEYDATSDGWGWPMLKTRMGEQIAKAWPELEVNVRIEDEDSKLNLRKISPERLAKLFERMGWTDLRAKELARAVQERVAESASVAPTAEGESSGQSDASKAYLDLRLLFKLPGIAPLVLYGEDLNFNGKLDDNENDGAESAPDDDRNGELLEGLGRWVTVWGDGMVNPNMASERVLLTVPGISRLIAEDIVRKRQGGDGVLGTEDDLVFRTVADLKQLGSISRFDEMEYGVMAPCMRVSSECYQIRICVASRDGGPMLRVQSIVRRGRKGEMVCLSRLEDDGI